MEAPRVPLDPEQKNVIDKLAEFVARNGRDFENLTKEKQRENPMFAFLHGGEHYDYYNYKVDYFYNQWQSQRLQTENYQQGCDRNSYWDSGYRNPGGVSQYGGGDDYRRQMPPMQMHPGMGPGIPQAPWYNQQPPWSAGPYQPGISGIPPGFNSGPPMDINDGYRNRPAYGGPPPPPSFGYPGYSAYPPYQTDACNRYAQASAPLETQGNASSVKESAERSDLTEADIEQSENNLKAQHEILMQEQEKEIDDLLDHAREESVREKCVKCNLPWEQITQVIQPLIEACTKENISKGKTWIIERLNETSGSVSQLLADYLLARAAAHTVTFNIRLHLVYLFNDLLHHCKRRGSPSQWQKALQQVVPLVFNLASELADDEKRTKLNRVLDIWDSNCYLSAPVLEKMRPPKMETFLSDWRAEQLKSNQAKVSEIKEKFKSKYANLEQQHNEFSEHVRRQLAALAAVEANRAPSSVGDTVSDAGTNDIAYPDQQKQQSLPLHGSDFEQQGLSQPANYGAMWAGGPPFDYPPHHHSGDEGSDLGIGPPHHAQRRGPGSADAVGGGGYRGPPMQAGGGPRAYPPVGPPHQHHRGGGWDPRDQGPPGQNWPGGDVGMMPMGGYPGGYGPPSGYPDGAEDYEDGHGSEGRPGRFDGDGYDRGYEDMHYSDHRRYNDRSRDSRLDRDPPRFRAGRPSRFSSATPHRESSRDSANEDGRQTGRHRGGPPPEPLENRPASPAEKKPSEPVDLEPKCPFWELPAGLMHPLIRLCDFEFSPIDDTKLRLLAPKVPSERLLASIDSFYLPPSHDRTRDGEGWERLGLYEFYTKKEKAHENTKRCKQDSEGDESGSKRRPRHNSGGSGAVSPSVDETESATSDSEYTGSFTREGANLRSGPASLAYITAYPAAAIGQGIRTGTEALLYTPPPLTCVQGQLTHNYPSYKSIPGVSVPPPSLLPPGSTSGPPPGFPPNFLQFPPPTMSQPPPLLSTQLPNSGGGNPATAMSGQLNLPGAPGVGQRPSQTFGYSANRNRFGSRSRSKSGSRSGSRSDESRSRSRSRSLSRNHSGDSRSRSGSRSQSGSRSRSTSPSSSTNTGAASEARGRHPHSRHSRRSRSRSRSGSPYSRFTSASGPGGFNDGGRSFHSARAAAMAVAASINNSLGGGGPHPSPSNWSGQGDNPSYGGGPPPYGSYSGFSSGAPAQRGRNAGGPRGGGRGGAGGRFSPVASRLSEMHLLGSGPDDYYPLSQPPAVPPTATAGVNPSARDFHRR